MIGNLVEVKVSQQLEALRGELLAAVDNCRSQLLDATAIAFDMAVQTTGTYQYARQNQKGDYEVDEQGNAVYDQLPLVSKKKGRLLSFADGSAYTAANEDENGQPQGE